MPITIGTSDSDIQSKIRAIVFGPPGHTKTASSVTLSEYCPADWTHDRLNIAPTRTERVTLKDMLWIGFDSQATLGFKQLGVDTPMIDLSATTPASLIPSLREASAAAKVEVEAGRTKTIVIDTISALDEMLTMKFRGDGLDKFDLYREILVGHLQFATAIKAIKGTNILFLCHAKNAADTVAAGNSDSQIKMAENAKKKQDAWGTGTIIPAITGAALNHYRRDVSFIFSVSKLMSRPAATTPPTKAVEGFYFSSRHKEFDTKSRLILPDTLPADWREVKKFIS